MQELLADILLYIRGIWLKRRYIIIATWLICPIAWTAITLLPDSYSSQARVYADTQSILKPLLRGLSVQQDPKQQISMMVRTLLSRPNLEKIARESDLDLSANTTVQYETLINRLRSDISIRSGGGSRSSGPNIFTISYKSDSPEMAKNVVQSALNVFVENSLGEKRQDSDTAQRFLNTQIEEYEARLAVDEKKLADFKRKYSGVMPGSGSSYYNELKGQRDRLELAELQLAEAETELASAKGQLRQGDDVDPDGELDTQNRTVYDDRIMSLQQSEDELLIRYTERHPDVVKIKQMIADLKEKRAAALSSVTADGGDGTRSLNPVFQEMQININQLENNVASLSVRVDRYRRKVLELQDKIGLIPQVEAELTGLNRNYGITKGKYEDLLTRRENALISNSANQSSEDIKFRVIDPPRAPLKPTGPPRLIYLIGATLASFAVGIAISFLVSQIAPVISSPRQVTPNLGIPVFGVVSATQSSGMKTWARRKSRIFWLSNSGILVGLVCVIVINTVPELYEAVIQRVSNL